MRTKLFTIAVLGLFGFSLLFCTAEARAEDDVFVDLSVLDSLGRAPAAAPAARTPSASSVSSGPLFPVVKKAEPRKNKKTVSAKTRKKTVKAKKTAAAPKPEVKAEVKVETPENKIIIPEKAVVEPAMENTAESLNDSPFGVAKEETVTEVTSPAPVAPVAVVEEPVVENENPPLIEPMNAIRELPEAKVEEEKALLTPVPAAESVFDQTSERTEEVSSSVAVEEEKTPQPLIPADIENSASAGSVSGLAVGDNDILFAEDSDVLDEASQRKLDAIVAGFENPTVNKIAINAYNLDDGVDVFRKKRLNLYRAIAVRSYLLNKGYKNFSLKVITITEDAGKKNRVMVEELK